MPAMGSVILLLLLVFLLTSTYVFARSIPEDDESYSICQSYSPLPNNTCAVLFDKPGCHGWRFDLRGVRGFRILPFLHRSEAQSVLVRKGCVLYGYDISWRQGRVVVVNTNHEEGDMADDLSGTTELACRVNSAACYCHSYQHTPSGVYQIQPKTHVWDKVADNNIQVVGRKPGEEAEAEVGDEEEDDGIEMTGLLEELLFPD